MRRVLAAALLALAGPASAQIFSETNAAWAPGVIPYFGAIDPSFLGAGSTQAMWLPLTTPGCYPSGTALGSRGEAITFTRATTATYTDCAGVTQTCASGEMRVGCEVGTVRGLLVERATTNYVLNNRTHPKTTEATGALPTGAHVAWHEGTGTMTVAAGTATVTGLSCTAVSPGTLCTFTVTVGGTMTITTSAGTVTKAQIEGGSTKSSEVPTAGTAVARNADVATVPTPAGLDPARWCVEVTGTPSNGGAWTPSLYMFSAGTTNTANTFRVYKTGVLSMEVFDGTPASRLFTSAAHGFSVGTTHRVAMAYQSPAATARADGTPLAMTPSGVGTGVLVSMPTPIYLGGVNTTSNNFDGYLRDFKVYRSPLCR